MTAAVVTLIALIHPPTNGIPMSVVPPYGIWSVVSALEFVGQQEMILLHAHSFGTIECRTGA